MKQPNILFFLVDDLGWSDLGCYDSPFYETPNIDQLRSRGMLFTDAYAACPVCSPTRGSLLTGKYPATLGITDWIDWGGSVHPAKGKLIDVPYIKSMPLEEKTLAHSFSEAGYATWHIGKWHLGGTGHHPQDVGFHVNIGGCHMGSPGKDGYFSPWGIPGLSGSDVAEGTYLTDYLTDQAISLLNDHCGSVQSSQPFFLDMWYYLVHTPIEAPEELVEKYRTKARHMGLDRDDAFAVGDFYPTEHKQDIRIKRRIRQSDPVYAAMVEKLDQSVGRILNELERVGAAENTLIVFTSDNGGLSTADRSPTCNAPLSEGKGWMYEGGVREPLLISWPNRVAPGSICSLPVSSPDFYPTLLEAAGLPLLPTQHCDGESFLPAFSDPAGDTAAAHLKQRPLFWHYPHYGNQGGTPGSVIRKGNWKLLHFFEDDGTELYNLDDDISETYDRRSAEPKIEKQLKQELDEWRTKVEALIPQENTNYSPWKERSSPHHSA
jgi:arylsulfatase A-like enzyme